jgi:hypothetical protein
MSNIPQTKSNPIFNDRITVWSKFSELHLAKVSYYKSRNEYVGEVVSKETTRVVDEVKGYTENKVVKETLRLFNEAVATNKLLPTGEETATEEKQMVAYLLSRMLQKTFLNKMTAKTHKNGTPVRPRSEVIKELYDLEKAKEAKESQFRQYGPK